MNELVLRFYSFRTFPIKWLHFLFYWLLIIHFLRRLLLWRRLLLCYGVYFLNKRSFGIRIRPTDLNDWILLIILLFLERNFFRLFIIFNFILILLLLLFVNLKDLISVVRLLFFFFFKRFFFNLCEIYICGHIVLVVYCWITESSWHINRWRNHSHRLCLSRQCRLLSHNLLQIFLLYFP